MSLTDYLKCPGLELTLAVYPEEFPCPGCGQLVEIWKDERKRRCTVCGVMVLHPNPMIFETANDSDDMAKTKQYERLMELSNRAMNMGASGAALIASAEIQIEKELAALCSGNPSCEQYGKAPSCPPHVVGPEEFIKWRDISPYAIVVRIDVPSQIMFSDERRDVMRLLQETLAVIKQAAVEIDFARSKAFAGGSCKNIWCNDHPNCSVLKEDGTCRYKEKACPSMSGYGVNVTKLMEAAGWSNKVVKTKGIAKSNNSLWMLGLVLLIE